jgi:hypothetical protein
MLRRLFSPESQFAYLIMLGIGLWLVLPLLVRDTSCPVHHLQNNTGAKDRDAPSDGKHESGNNKNIYIFSLTVIENQQSNQTDNYSADTTHNVGRQNGSVMT